MATRASAREQDGAGRTEAKEAVPTDEELVARVRGGDPAAFEALFERHHRRVYAVALGVLRNPHDAFDVVQDAFVKVHRHVDQFEGSSKFYTWLYRIVMNLSIDLVRKRKSMREKEFDDALKQDGSAGSMGIAEEGQNPRRAVLRSELAAKIHDALGQLPEHHRTVILLREIEGLSYEEMSDVLGVPKGTIMSRLFHARKKLQESLQGYLDGDIVLEDAGKQ